MPQHRGGPGRHQTLTVHAIVSNPRGSQADGRPKSRPSPRSGSRSTGIVGVRDDDGSIAVEGRAIDGARPELTLVTATARQAAGIEVRLKDNVRAACGTGFALPPATYTVPVMCRPETSALRGNRHRIPDPVSPET
jgi:hypothetical protein